MAVEQNLAGGSNRVVLTRLGGGAFGNEDPWIDDAIMRALRLVEPAGLDIRINSFVPLQSNPSVAAIIDQWA